LRSGAYPRALSGRARWRNLLGEGRVEQGISGRGGRRVREAGPVGTPKAAPAAMATVEETPQASPRDVPDPTPGFDPAEPEPIAEVHADQSWGSWPRVASGHPGGTPHKHRAASLLHPNHIPIHSTPACPSSPPSHRFPPVAQCLRGPLECLLIEGPLRAGGAGSHADDGTAGLPGGKTRPGGRDQAHGERPHHRGRRSPVRRPAARWGWRSAWRPSSERATGTWTWACWRWMR